MKRDLITKIIYNIGIILLKLYKKMGIAWKIGMHRPKRKA
jgi:hypothetical protein